MRAEGGSNPTRVERTTEVVAGVTLLARWRVPDHRKIALRERRRRFSIRIYLIVDENMSLVIESRPERSRGLRVGEGEGSEGLVYTGDADAV